MKARPLDPLVSEFASEEAAKSYDTWLRAKVAASLADPRPSIPHDEAMSRVSATLEAVKKAKNGG